MSDDKNTQDKKEKKQDLLYRILSNRKIMESFFHLILAVIYSIGGVFYFGSESQWEKKNKSKRRLFLEILFVIFVIIAVITAIILTSRR